MKEVREARHITVSIACPPDSVYAFASNPQNLLKWATGLGSSIEKTGNAWFAETPLGRTKITFAPVNDFGVLDHDVDLPSGDKLHVPMRVVPNGEGSEVTLTLIRQADMSDAKFAEDAEWVQKDLNTLKSLLEKPS